MEYDNAVHSIQCPKCDHGMEEVSHGGVVIDRCTHCGGLWFDEDEASHLKALKEGHLLDTGSPREGWIWDSHADSKCPRCGKEMEKTSDPKQKHIWYEICHDHGIFMDAGEFTDFKFESLFDRFRALIKGDRNTVAP